jgi:hypothetical protein
MRKKNRCTISSPRSIASGLKKVIGEEEVEQIARETGFLKRKRKVAPLGLLVACLSTLGVSSVKWLADILRTFNKQNDESLQYKPFHNQLKKKAFPEFLRLVLDRAINKLTIPMLHALEGSKLKRFESIILHDGTSLALKDSLAEVWPGRFTKVSPAAIELHVTFDALEDNVTAITLTADKEAERQHAPTLEECSGCLVIEDRGYQSRGYFAGAKEHQVSFIIRGTKNIRPTIVGARDLKGVRSRRLQRLVGKRLSWEILPREGVDLDVEWGSGTTRYEGRIVIFYKKGKRNAKAFTYLHTNLDRADFSADEVGQLYRLRWQIELLFKEWKSHANLHKFDTKKEAIAEGMVWASLLAATLKRCLTHAAEQTLGIELSTDRVAKAARHFFDEVLIAILRGRGVKRAVAGVMKFLSINTRRAHPDRDRKTGRLASGLRPLAAGSSP